MAKLSKVDVQWALKKGLKNKIIKVCEQIITDPSSSLRAKGIAIKNILAINNQNIALVDQAHKDNEIVIKIEEKEPD